MAVKGCYAPYRSRLIARSREPRRALTAAEKTLVQLPAAVPAKFTRQKPLGVYIGDFYCASHRLVVEVDGDSHFSAKAEKRDQVRDAKLQQSGVRVMRFTNDDVMHQFEGVCLQIMTAPDQKP